eukprot:sb/3472441/
MFRWCGYCKLIAPKLEALAMSTQGEIRVGTLDTDIFRLEGTPFETKVIPSIYLITDQLGPLQIPLPENRVIGVKELLDIIQDDDKSNPNPFQRFYSPFFSDLLETPLTAPLPRSPQPPVSPCHRWFPEPAPEPPVVELAANVGHFQSNPLDREIMAAELWDKEEVN